MQVKNHCGATVSFDGAFVTIERTGWLERLSVGKGRKRISVAQITAIQFKPAGWAMSGFIQFTIGGGNERMSKFGSQTMDASRDENSVLFTSRQQPEFEQLRDAVEAAMVAPAHHGAGQPDAVDQLRRLAELRDAGVVNAQEFDTAKARLLGSVS
jgi:Domain of unknown function (DUF4429)/Short C-terminal domain